MATLVRRLLVAVLIALLFGVRGVGTSLADERDGAPFRVELDGVGAIPFARVSNPAVSGRDPARIWVVLDAESRSRVPLDWATGGDPPEFTKISSGGLPEIHADGPQARLGKESKSLFPAWWLDGRSFPPSARIDVKTIDGVGTWSVRWIQPTLVVPVRCRTSDGGVVACTVTDLWTCRSYASRSDGVAYLVAGAGSEGSFVVRPAAGAPLLLDREKVRAWAQSPGGSIVDLSVVAGARLPCRVRVADPEAAKSAQISAWVWDLRSGALLDSRTGTTESGLEFESIAAEDVRIVAQVRPKSGPACLGIWEGPSRGRDVELSLTPARFWYEVDDGETGVRWGGEAADGRRPGVVIRPVGDRASEPASVSREWTRRVVPGRYEVSQRGPDGALDVVTCDVRQGVIAVVLVP